MSGPGGPLVPGGPPDRPPASAAAPGPAPASAPEPASAPAPVPPSAPAPGPVPEPGPAPSYICPESLPYPFCPGCGHHKIAALLDQALGALALPPERVVVVTDIGCIGLTDRHFRTHAFHGLHGRSLTYASGIKLADPGLTVIVLMGDGGTGIGGAHLLAAARRNLGLTVLVANNFNYGMTGGQHSATTPPGARTATTPLGNLEMPLDLMGTLRPLRPAFLARTSVFAEEAGELVRQAVATEGFALVDIWSLCVAYYAGRNALNREAILRLMAELEMPAGIHYRGDRPEYARAWRALYHPQERADGEALAPSPPVERGLEPVAASRLEGRTSLLLAGSAGEKIKSAATLLGAGAILSGLFATQKDDYPITVRTGHSAAEVILSPEPILYTGVETPDIVLVLSAEGLAYLGARPAAWPPKTRIYLEESLGPLQTRAQVIPLPLRAQAKRVHRLALAAVGLGAVLRAEELYPPRAFQAAAEHLQKAAVAEINVAGLQAGMELGNACITRPGPRDASSPSERGRQE